MDKNLIWRGVEKTKEDSFYIKGLLVKGVKNKPKHYDVICRNKSCFYEVEMNEDQLIEDWEDEIEEIAKMNNMSIEEWLSLPFENKLQTIFDVYEHEPFNTHEVKRLTLKEASKKIQVKYISHCFC